MHHRRVSWVLAASLSLAVLSACHGGADGASPALAAHGPFSEAWETDTPARFSFPPVGLEDFALDIEHPGALRVVLHIGEDGKLLDAAAEQVQDLSTSEVAAVLDSFRKARFEPARKGGKAVASIKRIALDFDPNARYTIDPASTRPAEHR